jgi:vesicular inhibitory amino acid transporter
LNDASDDSHDFSNDADLDIQQYRAPGVYPKVVCLRVAVITVITIVSVIWKDHLLDLLDFVGASSLAASCMVNYFLFIYRYVTVCVPLRERNTLMVQKQTVKR